MRFLCLHGHGTNSSILEAQLEPLRAHLPNDWEFEFLDGEMSTPPTPGIDAVFPGPYVCYHQEPIPEEFQAAYDLVMEVIEEEGPFDGILGFSQGAALAAAVILNEAAKTPSHQPFKMAVFLSSTMPFDLGSGKLRLTYDGISSLSAIHQTSDGVEIKGEEGIDWITDCRSKGVIDEFDARRPKSQRPKGPQSIDVLLRYNPTTHKQRFHIPTAHVIGNKDDYADHGRSLAGMGTPKLTHVVTLMDGGHQLPRASVAVKRSAEAILRAVEQMRYQT